MSGSYQNDVFIGANKTTTFTVQEEPIPSPIDSYPLPTEYWAYPIEGQNTYWYTISSNWLGEPYITSGVAQGGGTSGNYFGRIQSDGLAPNSAHIMWTKPIQYGGVAPGIAPEYQANVLHGQFLQYPIQQCTYHVWKTLLSRALR